MSFQDWTEADIQALKAQEAKDLAVEMLHELDQKESGPISPGEVQLRELEYELKIKQAENEDAKAQRRHEQQIRELDLQLEQERAKAAQSHSESDRIREELKALIDRVRNSEESLSVSLERATREHRLEIERLETEFAARRKELDNECQAKVEQSQAFTERIEALAELQVLAENLVETRRTVEAKQADLDMRGQGLDEEIGNLEYEKTKRIAEVSQSQELELAKLRHEHEKQVLTLDRDAADKILAGLGLKAIEQSKLDALEAELDSLRGEEADRTEIDEAAVRERVRREFNITTTEPVDVTALYYQCRSADDRVARLNEQVEKLESELKAARQHIQGEPQRIATAVEAARTPIQNIVEPAAKR